MFFHASLVHVPSNDNCEIDMAVFKPDNWLGTFYTDLHILRFYFYILNYTWLQIQYIFFKQPCAHVSQRWKVSHLSYWSISQSIYSVHTHVLAIYPSNLFHFTWFATGHRLMDFKQAVYMHNWLYLAFIKNANKHNLCYKIFPLKVTN